MSQEYTNQLIENSDRQLSARRSLLRNAGILAGGFLAGGTLLRGSAALAQQASGDGTMLLEANRMGEVTRDATSTPMASGTSGARLQTVQATSSDTMSGGMSTNNGMMNSTMSGEGMMNDASLLRMTASGGPVPGLSETKMRRMSAQNTTNDIAILNSALLLEYLESEFYSRAVAADAQRSYLKGRVKDIAILLQRDEGAHVETVAEMIVKLGGQPISKPVFQFPAEVFISQTAFLNVSSILEENGVSAYLGAAPLVKSLDVLNFAASIYGVEARHSGLIRHYMGMLPAPRDLEKPITLAEATANAAPFIASDQMNAM